MNTIGELRETNSWLEVSCVTCTAVLHLHPNFIAKEIPASLKLSDAGHQFPCPYCTKKGTASETICQVMKPRDQIA